MRRWILIAAESGSLGAVYTHLLMAWPAGNRLSGLSTQAVCGHGHIGLSLSAVFGSCLLTKHGCKYYSGILSLMVVMLVNYVTSW